LVNYRTPLEVHVRQIVRHVEPDASDSDIAEARRLLTELQQKIQQGADFGALAKEYSQDKETAEKGGDMGFVTRGTLARPLELAVFGLQQGQLTDAPVRSPSGLHVLQVLERKDPQRKEFASVREEVARSLLKDRIATRTAETGANALYTALKGGGAWSKLTYAEEDAFSSSKSKNKLPTRRDSAWILRSQETIPRIGNDRELHEQIFTLSDKAPLAGKVFRVNESFYVVRLLDREVPDMTKFDSERVELREEALDTKRNRVLRDWLAYMRNQAKIQMNPAMQGLTSAGA
jgi:peptidyl-prolyl cis-trans isomerase SurA